jgi:hypothetical protein
MCDQPITRIDRTTGAETTFACRTCDGCIAARRWNWTARCVAEATQWKHALCVSLTYNDKAPGGYDAARFFAYHDVRAFVQRITAALRRIDKSLCVRFICAGEQGDRNGRCHWHLILWSDYDLRLLGEVTFQQSTYPIPGFAKGMVLDPDQMMTIGKNKRRLHWSLWARDEIPLGFVSFGAADQAGVSYVVSYCLKDQFTVEKSAGKKRVTRAENFATGLFRMSKRPAIGETWLMQELASLEDKRAVLPNTMLSVPGLTGKWYPSGTMREKLLSGFRAINDKRVSDGLGVAPQWPSLLAACAENPSDMELLTDVEKVQQDFAETLRAKEIDTIQKHRERRAVFAREYTLRCDTCVSHEQGRLGIAAGRWGYSSASDETTFAPDKGKVLYLNQIRRYIGHDTLACCETCGDVQGVFGYPRQGGAG